MGRRIALIFSILLGFSHHLHAAPGLPDTPAGQRAGEVLALFNEADGEQARAMGGAPGIGAVYLRDWEGGITLIMLSNLDFPAAMEAYREVGGILGLE